MINFGNSLQICNYQDDEAIEPFLHPKKLSVPFFYFYIQFCYISPPLPQVTIGLFSTTMVLPLIGFHINGTIVFCVWISFLLCNDFDICVVLIIDISFFFCYWVSFHGMNITVYLSNPQLRFIWVDSTF